MSAEVAREELDLGDPRYRNTADVRVIRSTRILALISATAVLVAAAGCVVGGAVAAALALVKTDIATDVVKVTRTVLVVLIGVTSFVGILSGVIALQARRPYPELRHRWPVWSFAGSVVPALLLPLSAELWRVAVL